MAAASSNSVERFLLDAERAARAGDRSLALELLVLALDTAPGDATVLLRAHAVRNMLAGPVAPMPSAEPTGLPPLLAVPAFPLIPNLPAVQPELSTLPALPTAPQRDDAGELPVVPAFDSPPPSSDDGAETTGRSIAPQPASIAPDGDSPPAPTKSLARRDRRLGLYFLWAALVVCVAAASLAISKPELIGAVQRSIQSAVDPLAKAQAAFRARRYDEARRYAEKALAHPARSGRAYLLLGQIALVQREPARASEALRQALGADSTWEVALTVGRLYLEGGDTVRAANAFLLAFERGAPSDSWPEIIAAQRLAGYEDKASYLNDLLRRTTAPTQGGDTLPRGAPPSPTAPPSAGAVPEASSAPSAIP